jgi:hypothetical protein
MADAAHFRVLRISSHQNIIWPSTLVIAGLTTPLRKNFFRSLRQLSERRIRVTCGHIARSARRRRPGDPHGSEHAARRRPALDDLPKCIAEIAPANRVEHRRVCSKSTS